MSDRDSDQHPNLDDIVDEDLDFDPITSDTSSVDESVSSGQLNETESDSSIQIRPLANRPITVVGTANLSTETQRVDSSLCLSKQSAYRTPTVGTVQEAVTAVSEPLLSHSELTPKQTQTEELNASATSRDTESVTIAETVGTGSISTPTVEPVTDPRYLQETTTEQNESIGTLPQTAIATNNRDATTTMMPKQSTGSQRPELNPEQLDPGYSWVGGAPYTTATPQCILHLAPTAYRSLPFLQRVLRDTYTEIEGGRPRTKTLSTHAGTFNQVVINGSIVTLDLTDEAWDVSVDTDSISISHEDKEMIPELRELISSLYGGKLGYLIINISAEDVQSRFRSDITDTLIELLLDAEETIDDTDSSEEFVTDSVPPIRLAEPRFTSQSSFEDVVGQYFGFSQAVDERVAATEAAQDARVRTNDWRRIALTRRQDKDDGESDEHYLWKAAISGGLAWQMKDAYTAYNEQISFDSFVENHLLQSGPIESEYEGLPDDEAMPDIHVSVGKEWEVDGVRTFIEETPIEPSDETDVVIEFETGRGEGSFNFRKLRETVEKYEKNSNIDICVVIPPRLLFCSESRARMIQRLVESTSHEKSDQDVALCIPQLDQYGCERLISVDARLDDWFGDTDD